MFYLCVDAQQPELTLEDILIFFSGSEEVPPLGFVPSPTISFNNTSIYPKASTCAFTLILPTKYDNYMEFKDKTIFGIKNNGGFGLL